MLRAIRVRKDAIVLTAILNTNPNQRINLKLKNSKYLNTLDYLNLANMYVHKNMTVTPDSCKPFTERTFGNFKHIVMNHNRQELLKKVWFAAGTAQNGEGHIWLQYIDEEKNVLNYETTKITPYLLPCNLIDIKKFSNSTKYYKNLLVGEPEDHYVKLFESKPGTKKINPTPEAYTSEIYPSDFS